jgi:hypothetical protein
VLFLALVFVPSGAYLLSAFPSWETMHMGVTPGVGGEPIGPNLPAFVVMLFSLTNITQGILGFYVATLFIRRGNTYGAYLQWMLGYFLMFFILVHGWDGTGYQRFFSATPALLTSWDNANIVGWVTSPVAMALTVMGVFFIPSLLWIMVKPLRAGYSRAVHVPPGRAARMSTTRLIVSILSFNVVVMPAVAVGASLAIRQMGPLLGTLVFALAAWLLLVRRGGLLYRHHRQLLHAVPLLRPAQVGAPPSPAAA